MTFLSRYFIVSSSLKMTSNERKIDMTNAVTLEGAKLKQIAGHSETATVLMFNLAERKRFRNITDISHLKNALIRSGEKIIDEDYIAVFKELEAIGVGSLIIGRRGKPSRFKWNYSLKNIGEAAINGKDVVVTPLHNTKTKRTLQLVPVAPQPKKRGRKPGTKNAIKTTHVKLDAPKVEPHVEIDIPVKKDTGTNVLYVALRPDFVFQTNLPKLSQSEADMLCEAIKQCV